MSFLLPLSRGETLSVWFHRLWPEFFSLWPAQKTPEETHRFDSFNSLCVSLSLFIIFSFLLSTCLLPAVCMTAILSTMSFEVHSLHFVYIGTLRWALIRWCDLRLAKLWNGFPANLCSTVFFCLPLCLCMYVCVCVNMCFLYVCVNLGLRVHAYRICV